MLPHVRLEVTPETDHDGMENFLRGKVLTTLDSLSRNPQAAQTSADAGSDSANTSEKRSALKARGRSVVVLFMFTSRGWSFQQFDLTQSATRLLFKTRAGYTIQTGIVKVTYSHRQLQAVWRRLLNIFIRLTFEIYAVSKSSFEQLKGANRYLFSVSSAKEMMTKPGIISISKAKLVKIDQKSVCI